MIPESQDREPRGDQAPVALGVLGGVGVLATIDFDHQPALRAGEIQDVAVERVLAAEFAALQLTAMGLTIDILTPEQVKYLSSWEEGT